MKKFPKFSGSCRHWCFFFHFRTVFLVSNCESERKEGEQERNNFDFACVGGEREKYNTRYELNVTIGVPGRSE